MAYKRRYLAGQMAVTVDIAQQAITPDKISPGAVGSEALAPDSVTGEKILPGTIETSDLKDGLITPEKISAGAVGSAAIKDAAVIQSKLSAALQTSVRPFSPGIAAGEIAALAVDHSKLALGAVESDSIKAGAVNSAAVAHDAIDDTKIADDAVQSEHVENGAIVAGKLGNNSVSEPCIINGSCTYNKLGIGSVYGDRIPTGAINEDHLATGSVGSLELQGDAVTEPKIQTAAMVLRHLGSFRVRNRDVIEEFIGQGISPRWRVRADAGGMVWYDTADQALGLLTPGINGQGVKIDWGEKGLHLQDGKMWLIFYMPEGAAGTLTYQTRKLGLLDLPGESQYLYFRASDVAGATPNWYAVMKGAGAEVAVDTGVAVTDAVQILRIEYISDGEVNLYINQNLVHTFAADVPTYTMDPLISLHAGSNNIRAMGVQMMSLIQERPDYV